MRNVVNTVIAGLPADVDKPPSKEIPKVKAGFDIIIGILLFIGPYIFVLGILAGVIWLVVGMFGHGEMKGGKWIGISVLAAVLFGGSFSIANFFL